MHGSAGRTTYSVKGSRNPWRLGVPRFDRGGPLQVNHKSAISDVFRISPQYPHSHLLTLVWLVLPVHSKPAVFLLIMHEGGCCSTTSARRRISAIRQSRPLLVVPIVCHGLAEWSYYIRAANKIPRHDLELESARLPPKISFRLLSGLEQILLIGYLHDLHAIWNRIIGKDARTMYYHCCCSVTSQRLAPSYHIFVLDSYSILIVRISGTLPSYMIGEFLSHSIYIRDCLPRDRRARVQG